jgi:hypothetical protein
MAEQPRPDDLAELRATVRVLQADLARLKRRRRFPRRFLPLAVVTLLVALMPLSILAADPVFSDLSDAAEVHRPNIQAIGNVGITTGFADPNNPNARLYNPKGLVTREEMASFLARTAGLGGNAPVVNAKTAQTAAQAGNATTVGGYAPSGLLRVGRGTGASVAITTSYQTVAQVAIVAPGPGFLVASGHMTINNINGDVKLAEFRLRDLAGEASESNQFSVPAFSNAPASSNTALRINGSGTRTIVLEVKSIVEVPFNFSADHGEVTALFIPFGYDGGSSLAPTP